MTLQRASGRGLVAAVFAAMLGHFAACSTSTGAGVAADAGTAGRDGGECCTPISTLCGPREKDGGCNRCCHGDACSFPPDPDGTCRGPSGLGNHCPDTAPTKPDIDQSGGWKPPPAAQNVCSASDITAFGASFKGAKQISDLIKGLPTACGTCILGKEADATWKFVVTDDRGELGFLNYGACYARAAGGSDACGQAVQYDRFCIQASCAACASSSESTACESNPATLKACSANFDADITSGCGTDPAKIKALEDACRTPSHAAAILCGNGDVVDSGGGG